MPDLLDRDRPPVDPTAPAARSASADDPDGRRARQAGDRADAAVALVDHTFHALALLGRLGGYGLLAVLAHYTAVGPHVAAGVLLGDCAAAVVIAARSWRQAPEATAAELALLAGLLLLWWFGYDWPDSAAPRGREFAAVLWLCGFAVAVGRLGAQARRLARPSGWD